MKQIYLFRHGQTDWNLQEKFQGHADIPLNPKGKEQARRLIEPLRRQKIEAILSSDLKRASETAQIIADALRVPLFTDEKIREGQIGEAEGLTRTEIENKYGVEFIKKWRSADPQHLDVCYPKGESGRQIMERATPAIENFLSQSPFERVGVATHGGVIRRFIQKIWPERKEAVPIPNGILYLACFEKGQWRLEMTLHYDKCSATGPNERR